MIYNAGKPCFAPKRYGYGAFPLTWEGWAATAVFVLAFSFSITICTAGDGGFAVPSSSQLSPLLPVPRVLAAVDGAGANRWDGAQGSASQDGHFASRLSPPKRLSPFPQPQW